MSFVSGVYNGRFKPGTFFNCKLDHFPGAARANIQGNFLFTGPGQAPRLGDPPNRNAKCLLWTIEKNSTIEDVVNDCYKHTMRMTVGHLTVNLTRMFIYHRYFEKYCNKICLLLAL